MADSQYEVGVRVVSTSETSTLRDVVAELQAIRQEVASSAKVHQDAGAAAKEHGDSLSSLKGVVADLTQQFLALTGLAGVIEWLRGGAKEAMDQEVALRALSDQVQRLGGDGADAAVKTKTLADQLERMGIKGLTDEGVIDGVQKLIVITGNYKEALGGVELAARVAAGTNRDYSEVLSIVTLLAGDNPRGVAMAHRQFGSAIGSTNAEILKNLDKLGSYNALLGTNKQAVADAEGALHELGREVGGPLSTALVWLIGAVKDIGQFFGALGLRAIDMYEVVVGAFKGLGHLIADFDIKHPLASFTASVAQYQEDEKTRLAVSAERWDEWGRGVEKSKQLATAPPKGGGGVPITPHGDPTKTQSEAAAKALDDLKNKLKEVGTLTEKETDEVVAYIKSLEQQFPKMGQDTLKELQTITAELRAKQKKDLAEERSAQMDWLAKLWQAEEQGEMDAAAKRRQVKLAALKKSEKDEEEALKRVQKLRAKMEQKDVADHQGSMKDRFLSDMKLYDEALAASQGKADADGKIAAQLAAMKKRLTEEGVAADIEALGQAFGFGKEVAVGKALFNTFEGITAALKLGFPLGLIAAALIGAEGFAQVAAIEGTEIGGGGGGRKSTPSAPSLGSLAATHAAPTGGGPSYSSTVHAPSQTTVNIHTLTGDGAVDSARKVQRLLLAGQRAHGRARLNYQQPVMGSQRNNS